jgi:hypothetical protein
MSIPLVTLSVQSSTHLCVHYLLAVCQGDVHCMHDDQTVLKGLSHTTFGPEVRSLHLEIMLTPEIL